MHAMLDLRGNLPAFLYITDGKVHDIRATPQVPIEREGIYILDRAYIDFNWLWSIHRAGAFPGRYASGSRFEARPRAPASAARGQPRTCPCN